MEALAGGVADVVAGTVSRWFGLSGFGAMSSGNCACGVVSAIALSVGVAPFLAALGVTTTGAGTKRGMIGNGKLDISTGAGLTGVDAAGAAGFAATGACSFSGLGTTGFCADELASGTAGALEPVCATGRCSTAVVAVGVAGIVGFSACREALVAAAFTSAGNGMGRVTGNSGLAAGAVAGAAIVGALCADESTDTRCPAGDGACEPGVTGGAA